MALFLDNTLVRNNLISAKSLHNEFQRPSSNVIWELNIKEFIKINKIEWRENTDLAKQIQDDIEIRNQFETKSEIIIAHSLEHISGRLINMTDISCAPILIDNYFQQLELCVKA